MGKYEDIINLPHHISLNHKPMSMEHRAAQFAPFAALSGHEDALAETARITESFKELSEDEIRRLSGKLNYVLSNKSKVRITYFYPDNSKKGGSYKKIEGVIKKWDETDHTLMMEDGKFIPICFISDIQILKDSNLRRLKNRDKER